MLPEVDEYLRNRLKEGLAQCTEEEQQKFKLMYSYPHTNRNIEEIVDLMPQEKLDWAIQQVDNTNKKRKAKEEMK